MSNTIGEAYLQIRPSMEGVKGELEEAMGKAGASSSSSFGDKFASGIKAVGAVTAAAVGAASAGVAKLTQSAVSSFAEYEQLVGGVETLFGDSADVVMQHANEAFSTAGLSANEYMETVTSFSASLLQSLDGDTQAAAATADMAIRDMADNANKMGTSMESIQTAYQGFAKQNYTMLDNLKLGYGGTKSEMERLLADATALTGIEYNIDSLDDVYSAIHVIQEELGIAGTTAEEAEGTISGSLASLGSAWQNLVTGFANPDADLGALISQVIDAALTSMDNLLPTIEQALVGIAEALVTLAPVIGERLPDLLNALLPPLIEAAIGLINGLVAALPDIITALIDQLPVIFELIVNTILELLPMLLDLGLNLILTLADGIIQALPELIPALVDVMLTIVDKLTEPDTLVMLIETALQLILALAQGLINALPKLIEKGPTIIKNLVTALIQAAPMILSAGVQLITTLVSGLLSVLSKVVEAGRKIVTSIKDAIMEKVNQAKTWGKDMIDNFVQGIKDKIQAVKDAVGKIASTVKDLLGFSEPDEGPLSNFHTFAPDMLELFSQGIMDNVSMVKSAMGELAGAVATEWGTPELASPSYSAVADPNERLYGYMSQGQLAAAGAGDICIPVYIGNEKLDELIISAQQRTNYRSGGR